MTEEQYQRFRSYLRDLADAMGLRDWTVTLDRGRPGNPNHNADITMTYGRKQLVVCICDAFLNDSPEEQRQTFVHELLHAHINPIKFVFEKVETNLGDHVYGVVKCFFEEETEYAVDALADLLAPSMPLPPPE